MHTKFELIQNVSDLSSIDVFDCEQVLRWLRTIEDANHDPVLDDGFAADLATIEDCWPGFIYGQSDPDALAAIDTLIFALARQIDYYGVGGTAIPGKWFQAFYALHLCGFLSAEAWGVAARYTYTHRIEPWRGPNAMDEALLGFRAASPVGLMTEEERLTLLELPDLVRVFRGGCADSSVKRGAELEVARGLSWSLNYHDAVNYMRHRCRQRAGDASAGWPVVLSATISKRDILALIRGAEPEESQLVVDFERLNMATMRGLPLPSPSVSVAELRRRGPPNF